MKPADRRENIPLILFTFSLCALVAALCMLFLIPTTNVYISASARQMFTILAYAKATIIFSVICGLSGLITCFRIVYTLRKAIIMLVSQPVDNSVHYPSILQPLVARFAAYHEQSVYGMDNMKILNSYISHEIKNTLNILSAMVELQEPKTDILAYIKKISDSMEDILILSEVSVSGITVKTDLALICAEVVDAYRKTYSQIIFDLPNESVSLVLGYDTLLRRAISNLLSNAVKYGNGGKITLRVYEHQQSVVVNVQDQGQGFSTADLEHLFEPNYRISKLKRDSHGIGLSLVKNVADLVRGSVWAENIPDGGASFYFVMRASNEQAGDACV